MTRFFRDQEAFEIIRQQVIPAIFAAKHAQEPIRIWTPGCATGEETYSLAMIIQEYMEQQDRYLNVKILGTDIDTDALGFAGHGRYPPASLEDLAAERLEKFFLRPKEDSHDPIRYEVTRNIRNMIVFARQNLIKDPPFAKLDLIVCRNLLIYLQPQLQQQVLSIFQFALRPSGFLFLGSSESVGDFTDSFEPISAKWKIYQYHSEVAPRVPIQNWLTKPNATQTLMPAKVPNVVDQEQNRAILYSLVEQAMAPCVVVDEAGMLIHAFGDLDAFLLAPIGLRVTLNIRNMVPASLAAPLSSALHRTFAEGERVHYRNLRVERAGRTYAIHLSTRPFQVNTSHQKFALVTFALDDSPAESDADTEEFRLNQTTIQHIANLEQELQYTRENLQSTIEELETSNEELQATNEELLAANEELQSTNEELQSVNEELITVNTEYQMRIRELTQLNDDINNLFDATPVGMIFLDAELNVRKFTPAVQQVINLLHQDIGRPLHHLSHQLIDVDLATEARYVLQSQSRVTMDVRAVADRWYRLELFPYMTHAHHIAGVIVALANISERTHMQGQLANDQVKLNAAVEAGGLAFWEMELATGHITFSRRKAEILGYKPQKFNHYRDFTALIHADDYEMVMEAMRRHLQAEVRLYEAEYRIRAHDQGYRWFKDIGQVTQRDNNGVPLTVVGITTDTTDLHELTEAAASTYAMSQTLTEQAAIVHELMPMVGYALWHVDHQRGLIECSQALADLLDLGSGTTPQQSTFLAKIHPDDQDSVAHFLAHGNATEKVVAQAYRIIVAAECVQLEQYSRTFYCDGCATHSTAIVKLPA